MLSEPGSENRVFPGLELVALCLIAFFVLSITWKIPIHNYQLWTMQRNFRSKMRPIHPTPSQLRAEMAEFGNFGQSNHCDYFVGEFRSAPLSKEALRHAYATVATSSFIGDRWVEIGIYFIDEDTFRHSPLSEWLEKYMPERLRTGDENIYLIFSEDENNPPDGDIRCH